MTTFRSRRGESVGMAEKSTTSVPVSLSGVARIRDSSVREVVASTLGALKHEGLIDVHRGVIVVLDSDRLAGEADELRILHLPEPFYAVGQWYDEFGQVTDDRVVELLSKGRAGS